MENENLMKLVKMSAMECSLAQTYSESEDALDFVFKKLGEGEQVKRLPTAEEIVEELSNAN